MTEELCLHCSIIEVINAHYKAHGPKHGDDFVMDMHEILDGLCRVVAEMIAAAPDKKERDHLAKDFARGIRDAIPVIRGRGEGNYPKPLLMT